jgi:hypothetical protein
MWDAMSKKPADFAVRDTVENAPGIVTASKHHGAKGNDEHAIRDGSKACSRSAVFELPFVEQRQVFS